MSENRFDRLDTKLDNIKDDQHELDKKVDIALDRLAHHMNEDSRNLEQITTALGNVSSHLEVYNSELKVHIAGVQELRTTNNLLRQYIEQEKLAYTQHMKELDEQIKDAGAPVRWIKAIASAAIWISAIGAALGTIGAALHWIFKIF